MGCNPEFISGRDYHRWYFIWKITPTEASGVAVAYAFILSVFIYRTIKLSEIPKLLVDAAVMTTIVMLIIGASSVLSFVMSFTGLPAAIQ